MKSTVTFRFVDGNANMAEVKVHCKVDYDHTRAVALAAALAGALQGISSARLQSYVIEHKLPGPEGQAPQPGARVGTLGLLFYRNGDDTSSVALPSVKQVLAEEDGPFAGLRITRDRLAMLGVLEMVDNLCYQALDPIQRQYGNYFSVGCIFTSGETR